MLRSRSILTLFSLITLASCSSDKTTPTPVLLEGRWNQASHTEFYYDAQGNLLRQIAIPKPTDTPFLIITSTQIEEHANNTVSVVPRYTYTRQQNRLRYSDGTILEITELTANALTLRGPATTLATGPLSDPQGKVVTEKYYSR
ncbi:hypothetical protein [Hymenobacter actinosclerus]|uniref:YD repeat-containing protein n=1 Tax=Hymenobacter actinosclerus TaxID=82805 RepID=A0A1I0HEL8_9BACT|nr:hypothetical protein [Hymenobacter actinosclerus]SET81354.1 YD repeat-containing protein [Hymenobacter actinosclerus]